MVARILVLSICFLSASAFVARVSKTESVPIRLPLAGIPKTIGKWQGEDTAALDTKVLNTLGVDDYLSRVYTAGNSYIGLYIGFYESQRTGSTIHSPLNCLPGSGWNPVDRTTISIPVASMVDSASEESIEVNLITIQKGLDRQVVLYWYQAHGRVIGSEYWGKIYTVLDAVRMNRTDAALVRIISPLSSLDVEGRAAAEEAAVNFVQSVFPLLSQYLPD
jgi:EpsI family protein